MYINVIGVYIGVCSPLPGNHIVIIKYLARRGVVVSGGSMDLDGNRLQNTVVVVPDTGGTRPCIECPLCIYGTICTINYCTSTCD